MNINHDLLAASRNQLQNVSNPYQGPSKRVLCVCSAGLLRSPTLGFVLSKPPYNFNCRAVGVDVGHALIPVTEALLCWADIVVAVDEYTARSVKHLYNDFNISADDTPLITLSVPDKYARMDKKLIAAIKKELKRVDENVYQLKEPKDD